MAELVQADGVTPLRRMLTSEIASASIMTARSVLTGHPAEGLDPARLAAILRGAEDGDPIAYLELAEQMEEKDLHYLSVLGTRKRQVAQLPITVEAASDMPIDQAKAQLIRDWLKRDTLEAEIFDMLDAIGKGFSMTEIVWDARRAPFLPSSLIWRDPRWFQFDRIDGTTPLLRGTGMPQPLPPFKFINHIAGAKSGLPIRSGLARPVAWAYLFKNFGLKDWVSFAEVYGFPIRIGKYEAGATEADIRTLMRAVANISQDAAAVIPRSMEIELAQGNSTGSADLYAALLDYLDKQISKAVLGQTATTDMQTGGGLGSSGKQHSEVRADIERADAKALSATLNRDLVRPIIDFNFGRASDGLLLYPQINIGREDREDTTKLLANTQAFVAMGGKVAISSVRDKLGWPDPQAGEELLTAPVAMRSTATESIGLVPPGSTLPAPADMAAAAAATAPGGTIPPKIAPPAFLGPLKPSYPANAVAAATAAGGSPAPMDDIDQLVQVLADEGWQAALGPMIDPLVVAMAGAADYDAAIAALVPTLASMDTAALATRLERAAFAVRAAAATGADGQLSHG